MAAPYGHWSDVLILGAPSLVGPSIVPCHITTLWLWLVIRQIEAIDTHSGFKFPFNPTNYIPFYGGAEYHDYHHFVGEHSQSNFSSLFTVCDYLYGTDKVGVMNFSINNYALGWIGRSAVCMLTLKKFTVSGLQIPHANLSEEYNEDEGGDYDYYEQPQGVKPHGLHRLPMVEIESLGIVTFRCFYDCNKCHETF